MKLLQRLGADASGATAIEYGLIAGLVSLAFIVAAALVGQNMVGTFSSAERAMAPSSGFKNAPAGGLGPNGGCSDCDIGDPIDGGPVLVPQS